MKIRTGFVSNSSSASFIVTIHKKFSNERSLYLDLYENCWCAFHDNESHQFNEIARVERELAEYEASKSNTIEVGPLDSLILAQPERAPRVRVMSPGYIEDNDDKANAIMYTLDQEGIILKLKDEYPELCYYTTMFNSFHDMNRLLQCIYFEYKIKQGGASLKVEDDN